MQLRCPSVDGTRSPNSLTVRTVTVLSDTSQFDQLSRSSNKTTEIPSSAAHFSHKSQQVKEKLVAIRTLNTVKTEQNIKPSNLEQTAQL